MLAFNSTDERIVVFVADFIGNYVHGLDTRPNATSAMLFPELEEFFQQQTGCNDAAKELFTKVLESIKEKFANKVSL